MQLCIAHCHLFSATSPWYLSITVLNPSGRTSQPGSLNEVWLHLRLNPTSSLIPAFVCVWFSHRCPNSLQNSFIKLKFHLKCYILLCLLSALCLSSFRSSAVLFTSPRTLVYFTGIPETFKDSLIRSSIKTSGRQWNRDYLNQNCQLRSTTLLLIMPLPQANLQIANGSTDSVCLNWYQNVKSRIRSY